MCIGRPLPKEQVKLAGNTSTTFKTAEQIQVASQVNSSSTKSSTPASEVDVGHPRGLHV